MTSKLMYFGTKERMTWVKCPAFDMGMSKVGWGTTSLFLNGGASVRRSSTSHKEYGMSWNLASHTDIAEISDYADGLYGDDLIYFLDPFAIDTNLLPQYWAVPRLAAQDGPVFTGSDVRPTQVATESNPFSYPTMSAVYTFDVTSNFASLYIPLPTGYTFHFGAHGASTGTAAVAVSTSSQVPSVTTRFQLVKNPNSATTPISAANYGTGGVGNIALTAGAGESGSYGAVMTWTTAGTAGGGSTSIGGDGTTDAIPVVAGTTITASVAMKVSQARTLGQGGIAARVDFFTSGGAAVGSAILGTAVAATAGQEQRVSLSTVVPATATRVRVSGIAPNLAGTTAGYVQTVSRPYVSVTAGTYFDGYTLPTLVGNTRTDNMWQGTPNASVSQQTITVAPGTGVVLLSSNTSQLTNYTVTGETGVYISFWGSGSLTLSGMIAQVLPTGTPAPVGDFISGKGHSGCRFAPPGPVEQGYSAPQALNYKSLTATLIETGAWE